MTDIRIVHTRPDGGVSVVMPAEGWRKKGETDADFIARIRAKDVPADAINVVEILTDDLPYRGSFRNAWRQAGAANPKVDMPLARVIKTDQVREEREPRIKQASIDYQNADIAGDIPAKNRAAQKILALKDLPATIQPDLDAIATPEMLEAWQPDWP